MKEPPAAVPPLIEASYITRAFTESSSPRTTVALATARPSKSIWVAPEGTLVLLLRISRTWEFLWPYRVPGATVSPWVGEMS